MDLVSLVVSVASLVTAGAAIVGLYLTRRQLKDARGGSSERNARLAETVQKLSEMTEVQRGRLDAIAQDSSERNGQLAEAVKNLAEIVQVERRQVDILAHRLDALVGEQQRRVAIAERQVLQNQQQQNWNVLDRIGRVIGWAWDRGFFDSTDED